MQPPPTLSVPLTPTDFVVSEVHAAAGERLFGAQCAICHGTGAIAGGMAPDLRASPVLLDLATMASVVRDGARLERAMPQFPELTDDQLRALTHYVRKMASEAKPILTPSVIRK